MLSRCGWIPDSQPAWPVVRDDRSLSPVAQGSPLLAMQSTVSHTSHSSARVPLSTSFWPLSSSASFLPCLSLHTFPLLLSLDLEMNSSTVRCNIYMNVGYILTPAVKPRDFVGVEEADEPQAYFRTLHTRSSHVSLLLVETSQSLTDISLQAFHQTRP